MRIEDIQQGYALEVPDTWKRQGRKLQFLFTGGKIAFQSPSKEANVNLSIGPLDKREWNDRYVRRMALLDFLARAPPSYGLSDYIEEVENFQLDGEDNTVYIKHAGMNGYGRIISSVHNRIEYVFQSRDSRRHLNGETIDGIIGSFRFITSWD